MNSFERQDRHEIKIASTDPPTEFYELLKVFLTYVKQMFYKAKLYSPSDALQPSLTP